VPSSSLIFSSFAAFKRLGSKFFWMATASPRSCEAPGRGVTEGSSVRLDRDGAGKVSNTPWDLVVLDEAPCPSRARSDAGYEGTAPQARRHHRFEGSRTVEGRGGVEDDRLGQCPWRPSSSFLSVTIPASWNASFSQARIEDLAWRQFDTL